MPSLMKELAEKHTELLTELRALRNGQAQEDDHIVAAILLVGSKAEHFQDSQHFLGVAALDSLENIEQLLQKARDSGGTVED